MSDDSNKPEEEDKFPAPSGDAGASKANPDAQPNNPGGDFPENGQEDPREALKAQLGDNRVPPDVKAQILAELPPPEEFERQLRELIESGDLLSAEEFFASLGIEYRPGR